MNKCEQLVNAFASHLESNGWLVIKTHGRSSRVSGLPHIVALQNGISVAVFAGVDKARSPGQMRWADKFEDAGATVIHAEQTADIQRVVGSLTIKDRKRKRRTPKA